MANRSHAKKHDVLRRKQRLSRRQLLHQQLERRELLAGDAGPWLISVNPNAEEIFARQQTNPLSVRPTELTFRFGGTADIDASTLDAIRITRSGGDGQFGDGDDVVVEPGYIGFGETNRVVVARFAEALPDDLFQIDIFAEDGAGVVGLRDIDGNAFQPTDSDADRETLRFDLELGARVTAVVPQPVIGSGASRQQLRDEIHVYFDDPDLFEGPNGYAPELENADFYRLIRTGDTVGTEDDMVDGVHLPIEVNVDVDARRVELRFVADLHTLSGSGTFRLRVGTAENIAPDLTTIPVFTEPASDYTNATDLGTLGAHFGSPDGRTALLIDGQSIEGPALPFDYPGAVDEPGHRDIQDENHFTPLAGPSGGIAQHTFTVRNGIPYGSNSLGQTVHSDINPDQQQRIREIFDYYGELFGIDFTEVDGPSATHVVVVGDMFPNGVVSGIGGVGGVAGNGLAIMDGAESWDDSQGGSFFNTAMHEIGHLLGLGHTYDLPMGTIMGDQSLLGPYQEWVFPGNHDIVHGQYLYRPDNRDVDMYRFDVAPGEAGAVTIETIAERLQDSSALNTHLSLYRQTAAGVEKIAANDDSFGNDSFLTVELSEGTYFVAVTAQGNEDFDPTKADTGSGGTSKGLYDLRVEFRSTNDSGIRDTSGTPLDGDGDGKAGGNFNFWFKANDPATTRFVDPSATAAGDGSVTSPFQTLVQAINGSSSGDIIRMLPSAGSDGDLLTLHDNRAYEIGLDSLDNPLADGANLIVPAGVTVMVDPGAILKMRHSRISVGSGTGGIDASLGALQVLGTPEMPVHFTSYNDASIGINTNSLDDTPAPGDWGGVEFRNDIDRFQGRKELEREGIFLNYVASAAMRYGGGQVRINNEFETIAPIDVTAARPTILHNTITHSNSAAISADPSSFEETTFNEPRYQRFEQFVPDYTRVGPQIYGNAVTENSINGLFVRVEKDGEQTLRQLEMPARFANTEIVHVLGENLLIRGNPGGAIIDEALPGLDLVEVLPQPGAGALPFGDYQYRISFVDAGGNETRASDATTMVSLLAPGRITLDGLPVATGDFVARRLYRSFDGGSFQFITDLNRSQQTLVDGGLTADPDSLAIDNTVARPRIDARLTIDPGIILKSSGVRIQTGFGADLIAEGVEGRQVVLTDRADDRYGAGGTFNTNNSTAPSSGTAGSWAGIYASPFSTISLDHAVVAYAGGTAGVAGREVTFNPLELRQARARVAHSVFEFNASGFTPGEGTRRSYGPNEPAVIYVAGVQPVIVNNIFRDNMGTGTAMISIDADALNAQPLDDFGRQTGNSDPVDHPPGNLGPLVHGNAIQTAAIGGMRVRGGTLTTETVWDDTDIVHVLESSILVPDFHTYGGLRLQSRPDESLVAKFGQNATLIADGRPLDIEDRIGGRIHVLGAPGFPVIMTSLADDSVGAGFGPLGQPDNDTNGDGPSTGSPGDWRGIQLNEFSHDRNVATIAEREGRIAGAGDSNSLPGTSQFTVELSSRENSGDENLRLGATILGTIADPGDIDVYSFRATAGTTVWLDLDRTGSSLDSVLELINANGVVLARSNDSYYEDGIGQLDLSTLPPGHAMPMRLSPFALESGGAYQDLHSLNPLDAAMRVVLPGVSGAEEEYFVRIKGHSDDTGPKTTGTYQLQVRLREADEFAGSTVQFANIHYAQVGIEARGLPAHSLLTGEAAVPSNSPTTPINLGNILNSDRATISVAGQFNAPGQANTMQFRIERDSTQNIEGGVPDTYTSVTIDVDYADGFARPDTTAWLYRIVGGSRQLVMMGTDSNIAADRAAPGEGTDVGDLARGSAGSRDAYIGTVDLPAGDYELVVTNNSLLDSQIRGQYFDANPSNIGIRLQPNDSVVRVAEDRDFNSSSDSPLTTAVGPQQVAFDGLDNAVPFALGDVTLFVTGTGDSSTQSRLSMNNAHLGYREAVIGNDFSRVGSVAMDPRGRLVGFVAPPSSTTATDANTRAFLLLDGATSNGSVSTAGSHGLSTFEAHFNTANPPVRVLGSPVSSGSTRNGDGMIVNALGFRINDNDQSENRLFGVAGRGNGEENFDRPIIDFSDNSISGIQDNTNSATSHLRNAQNILYRFNPDNGDVINASSNGASRAGNLRGLGAGTDGVEVGYLQTSAGDVLGNVTGMAFINNTMFAVTTEGELIRLNSVSDTNSSPNTPTYLLNSGNLVKTPSDPAKDAIRDPVTGDPIVFSGLTRGPVNIEDGKYGNLLFATSSDGYLYAIDSSGELQPIFAGGQLRIATEVSSPTALAFSNLDVNLWGVTNHRGGDSGHGIVPTPTNTRHVRTNGGHSLHFGYTQSGSADAREGDWEGGENPDSRSANSYNFAGGAKGTIESYAINLSEYSLEDQPTMYFNYFLDSEAAGARVNAADQMRDSLRVYAAGDDNVWRLVATNNLDGYDDDFSQGSNHNDLNEFDQSESRFVDENGRYRFVQKLFNTSEWRQARIPMAPFAGSSNVRVRVEFNSAGEPDQDVVELRGLPGDQLTGGVTFEVGLRSDFGTAAAQKVFEFDHGVVLDFPSGAAISHGDTLTIEGQTLTFVSGPAGPNEVSFFAADTAEQLTNRVRATLIGMGIGPFENSLDQPSWLNLPTATALATVTGSLASTSPILEQPGVSGTNVPVAAHIGMTAAEIRDSIRTALAAGLNDGGLGDTNESIYPIYGDSVRIFGGTIIENGPLPFVSSQRGATGDAPAMPGTRSGLYQPSGEQNQAGLTVLQRLRLAGERARANTGEGVFIDDIIIGAAERGEMVTGANTGGVSHSANPQFEPIVPGFFGPVTLVEVTTGRYQVELRTSVDYATIDGDQNVPDFSIHTNDVIGQQFGLEVVGAGSAIRDGDAFTLSDGVDVVRFEFEDEAIGFGLPRKGVTSGSIAISFRSEMSAEEVASAIRDAINSAAVRNRIDVRAASIGGEAGGVQSSRWLVLHGDVAVDRWGGRDFQLPTVLESLPWGLNYSTWTGDRNRVREQGQVILANNVISNSSMVGIHVDAGRRDRSGDTTGSLASTGLPRPGSPINFPTLNSDRLAPSVVIVNNVLVDNRRGGVEISGAPVVSNLGSGPIPFARVINNTIVGNRVGDFGIRVENNASPSLINNAIIDQSFGIQVASNGGHTVEINGTLYSGNSINASGTFTGTNPVFVSNGQLLFIDAASGNFIPAADSQLIDSSIQFTADRLNLGSLRDALGMLHSPIVAPERDMTGQLRVNDPTVGGGVGSNVFIDRGALDRSDSIGVIAELVNPLDNDATGLDLDPGDSSVRLADGSLRYFEIKLVDPRGAGPNGATLTADTVILTENGRRLVADVDYIFSYSDSSNTIRLTSRSGVWSPDGAYEITLNNRDRIVIQAPSGDEIQDGEQIVVTDENGTRAVLEFETGYVLNIPQTLTLAIPVGVGGVGGFRDGDQFEITTPSGSVERFELNVIGSVSGNATAIPVPPAASATGVRDAILAVLSARASELNLAPVAIGSTQIQLGSLAGHEVDVFVSPMQVSGVDRGVTDGDTLIYNDGTHEITFEFNLDGDPNTLGDSTIVTFNRTDTAVEIAEKLATAVRVSDLNLADPRSLGDGRVHLGGSRGDILDTSGTSIGQTGIPQITGSYVLRVADAGADDFAEGDQFSITHNGTTTLFEFSFDYDIEAGAELILLTAGEDTVEVATRITDAIINAAIGLTPTLEADGSIRLNEPFGYELDLLGFAADPATAALSATGVPGGAVSVPIVPFASLTPDAVAALLASAVRGTTLTSRVFTPGGGSLWFAATAAIDGIDTIEVAAIRDSATNRLQPNRANEETQFTILMPDVVLDFGDAPTSYGTSLAGNGARHTINRDERPRLGATIESELDGVPGVSDGIDEDGLPTGSVPGVFYDQNGSLLGFLNPRVETTEIDVITVGGGLLDAWIDFNQDGDWNDPGEQVFANQLVLDGVNRLQIKIRPDAVVVEGDTWARFRLSQTGNLGPLGVAIGGEVEDYRVAIADVELPEPTDDSYAMDEDGTLSSTTTATPSVLDNDTDHGAASTTVTVVQDVQNGTLTANPDGTFIYTPNANFAGVDTFTYRISGNHPHPDSPGDLLPVQSDELGTVTITVNPVNDAPEVDGPSEIPTLEDAGFQQIPWADYVRSGPLTAVDELNGTPSAPAQTVSMSIAPASSSSVPADLFVGNAAGVTIDASGRIRFTPALHAFGSAVFVVTATDTGPVDPLRGDVNATQQTVTIHVHPQNDPPQPVPPPARYTLREDGSQFIPFSDLLDRFVVGPPNEEASQTLAIVPFAPLQTFNGKVEAHTESGIPGVLYTPDPDYNAGPGGDPIDTFFYTVTDDGMTFRTGTLVSDPLTAEYSVELLVEPVNDAPSFTAGETEMVRFEDEGPIAVPGWATDIAPGPLTAIDETDPATGQTVTFDIDPAAGFTDADITALFAVAPSIDVDGRLTFTPADDAVGTVVLEVRANDGGSGSETGNGDENLSPPVLLTITLQPVNDAPVANPSVIPYSLDEDHSIVLPLRDGGNGLFDIFAVGPANEADPTVPGGGQSLSTDFNDFVYSPTTPGGSLEPEYDGGGNWVGLRYTPNPDFQGIDSFIFGVFDDGQSYSATLNQLVDDAADAYATVSLTVNPVNDRPQFAGAPNVTVAEDAGATGIENWVTGILAGPANTDETSGSTRQQVSFEITPVSPVSGTPWYDLFTAMPTVNQHTGELVFTTKANAHGSAVFEIVAEDTGPDASEHPENLNRSEPRRFTITVTAVNDAPTFTAGPDITILEDNGPYNSFWANDISPGPSDEVNSGQGVSFDVTTTDPSKFSSQPTLSDQGLLQFTPAENASGEVDIVVTARDTDGAVAAEPYTLSLSITATNDVPVAANNSFTTDEDTILTLTAASLLGNDTDADLPLDTLSITGITGLSQRGATVTLSNDGTTVTYDPTSADAIQSLRSDLPPGTDIFTYWVVDEAEEPSNLATVTLSITGINDAPIARPDAAVVHPTNPTTFYPLQNDTDIDGAINPASVVITLEPAFGTLEFSPDGAFTYTPSPTFQGNDRIRYVVHDFQGKPSQSAEIVIGVNHPPQASADSVTAYRNESVTFSVISNDRDSDGTIDPTTVEILSGPSRGQTIVHNDGTITYVPSTDYAGNDSFTYQVKDDDGAPSNIATVSLRVLASTLQNPGNSLDVNDSGEVSPIDALLIINYLNRNEASVPAEGPPYYDVDGNGQIGPLDALRVINSLNRDSTSGEGEGGSATPLQAASENPASGRALRIDSPETLGEATGPAAHDWDFGQIGELEDDRLDDLLDDLARRRDDSSQDEESSLDAVWSSFGGGQA